MCVKPELGAAIASGVAALGSLVVAFLMYRSRPLAVRSVEKHSEELRQFLQAWYLELSRKGFTAKYSPGYELSTKFVIEEHALFDDIAQHLPSEVKLLEDWQQFKNGMRDYSQDCVSLWEQIQSDMQKATGLRYDYDQYKQRSEIGTINHQFINKVYEESLNLASEIGAKEIEKLSHKEIRDYEDGLCLRIGGLNVAFTSIEAQANLAFEVLALTLGNLSKDGTRESNYVSQLKQVLKQIERLQTQKDEMLSKMQQLQLISIFPGECKYLKWSKK